MAVDLHEYRLAPPPHGDNARDERIIAVWVLVGDHETASGDLPLRPACVAPPLAMMLKQCRLDVSASEAKLLRLVERVECPTD
jgi:hypothetical protein